MVLVTSLHIERMITDPFGAAHEECMLYSDVAVERTTSRGRQTLKPNKTLYLIENHIPPESCLTALIVPGHTSELGGEVQIPHSF